VTEKQLELARAIESSSFFVNQAYTYEFFGQLKMLQEAVFKGQKIDPAELEKERRLRVDDYLEHARIAIKKAIALSEGL